MLKTLDLKTSLIYNKNLDQYFLILDKINKSTLNKKTRKFKRIQFNKKISKKFNKTMKNKINKMISQNSQKTSFSCVLKSFNNQQKMSLNKLISLQFMLSNNSI